MTARTALVVTFDQLPASILGCCGNEWIETPHLDRLAADGFVADQCWAAHLGPTSAETAFAAESCLASLPAKQVHSSVLLEDASQTLFPVMGADSRTVVSGDHSPDAKPDRIPLAELVHAAITEWEVLRTRSRPAVVWLHARGLEIPALPPPGFAELYQDEFEDRGVRFDSLPDAERPIHPVAAAGMVSLFDHWLGELFAAVRLSELPVLTIVTAAAGARWQPWPNSFGELDMLRSQMAQVPLIAQSDGCGMRNIPASIRGSRCLSPVCVGSLLNWWFDDSETSWSDWLARNFVSQVITRTTSGAARVTTQDWAAILAEGSHDAGLLFRKPEDYWEVNNLAAVLPEMLADLRGTLPPSARGTSAF